VCSGFIITTRVNRHDHGEFFLGTASFIAAIKLTCKFRAMFSDATLVSIINNKRDISMSMYRCKINRALQYRQSSGIK